MVRERDREENFRSRSRTHSTTEFILADSRLTQQTLQSIVQCKPSIRDLLYGSVMDIGLYSISWSYLISIEVVLVQYYS